MNGYGRPVVLDGHGPDRPAMDDHIEPLFEAKRRPDGFLQVKDGGSAPPDGLVHDVDCFRHVRRRPVEGPGVHDVQGVNPRRLQNGPGRSRAPGVAGVVTPRHRTPRDSGMGPGPAPARQAMAERAQCVGPALQHSRDGEGMTIAAGLAEQRLSDLPDDND